MRKILSGLVLALAATAMLVVSGPVVAASCATIQGGTITDSAGVPLSVGYDQYGYNYQARMYNGTFDGLDRVLDGKYYGSVGDFVDDKVSLKWSGDWLANTDCNGDHRLDRGASGVSQGWETNHMVGDYVDADGVTQTYTYFAKIVWTGPGSPLWGEYTTIFEVYNDTGGGSYRFKYDGPPGFGLHDGWTTVG